MERVNIGLADEIKTLGASDLNACYSCGYCSALCPLSEGEVSFPRRMIRYALLGLEGKILSSVEPWLCYYCGECSETCPREADPGALMMALRRYMIRRYSIGRIADLFYRAFSSTLSWLVLSVIAVIGIILLRNTNMNRGEVEWLSFVEMDRLHLAGIFLAGYVAIVFLINIGIMVKAIKRSFSPEQLNGVNLARSSVGALREVLLQKRFGTCASDKQKRIAHLALFWGFAGMFLATLIVMGMDYHYLSEIRMIPFVLGSLSGIVTLLGSAYYIYLRFGRRIESSRYSDQSDWIFLGLISCAVLSGFAMVLLKYMHLPVVAYAAFAVHLVLVFDLLISLPFTKFSHGIYRPIALWISELK